MVGGAGILWWEEHIYCGGRSWYSVVGGAGILWWEELVYCGGREVQGWCIPLSATSLSRVVGLDWVITLMHLDPS